MYQALILCLLSIIDMVAWVMAIVKRNRLQFIAQDGNGERNMYYSNAINKWYEINCMRCYVLRRSLLGATALRRHGHLPPTNTAGGREIGSAHG